MQKQPILFITEDVSMLNSMKRVFYNTHKDWDIVFTDQLNKATNILSNKSVNVFVLDMSGDSKIKIAFLKDVRKKFPSSACIVLNANPDKKIHYQIIKLAHQMILLPADPIKVVTAIAKASALVDYLDNPKMRTRIARMDSLPSLPALYLEIQNELEKKNPSPSVAGKIIEKDIAMTAKILQLVNSALFALSREISDVTQAVMLLGLETVRDLVFTLEIFTRIDPHILARLGLSLLWEHSLLVGVLARNCMKKFTDSQDIIGQAFVSGLLHDVGKLILAQTNMSDYYSVFTFSVRNKVEVWQAEAKILAADHTQVGAYLLGLWGFSDAIVTATAFHHRPSLCPDTGITPLMCVHIANVIAHEKKQDRAFGYASPVIDQDYLVQSGLTIDDEQIKKLCI